MIVNLNCVDLISGKPNSNIDYGDGRGGIRCVETGKENAGCIHSSIRI